MDDSNIGDGDVVVVNVEESTHEEPAALVPEETPNEESQQQIVCLTETQIAYYREWYDNVKSCRNRQWRLHFYCKYIYQFLMLSVSILSYLFGGSGLAVYSNNNDPNSDGSGGSSSGGGGYSGGLADGHIQSIALLVIGCVTIILTRLKLEKRASKHKAKYNRLCLLFNQIDNQLLFAGHSSKIIPFVEFVTQMQRDYYEIQNM